MRRGDNVAGLEIMANGTPETFPLRGNRKTIEATWVRGTTNSAMVPDSLSQPPKDDAKIQIGDNLGKWAGFDGPIE